MPANLPPQYFETEKKLKTAKNPQEKILILEELLSIVPKHKGTEKLQALLKTKIAKLRSSAQKKTGPAKQGMPHLIEKTGAGQVVLVGPPNAGKTSLVNALTNAALQVADYPFTTHATSPAMMKFENIQIQLIDTPPLTADYMESWYPEIIKRADGILVVLDLSKPNPEEMMFMIQEKLGEKHIDMVNSRQNIPEEKKQHVKRAIITANKADAKGGTDNLQTLKEYLSTDFEPIPLSAVNDHSLEDLKKRIFELLNIIRVYSKIPGKKPDFSEPFTLRKGSTVLDMASAVHRDFGQKLKYARIWSEKKYQGQKVNRDSILDDGDIIELHL
ncbi:MAG: 50S ribosome-binding GTPase [Candidatus Aminicenantes bacterium]|nr:50S ribosome-binding GTPase [Candidatus Aminicenantes bacterium]